MAEVIGLISSIITILDLAGKVMGYLHSATHTHDDQRRLRDEISGSVVVLTMLKARVDPASPYATSLQTTRLLAAPGGSLEQYRVNLELIASKTVPRTDTGRLRSTIDKLAWPFKKAEVDQLITSLSRHNSLFNLALQDDHLSLSVALNGSIGRLDSKLDNVASQLDDVSKEQKVSAEAAALEEKKRIEAWLSPLDFSTTQNDTLYRRHKNTGTWIFDEPGMKTWLNATEGVLWCPGVAGAGKTIISAIVVDHLQRTNSSQDAAVLCVYLDFQNSEQQSAHNVTGALLRQLSEAQTQISPRLKLAYEQHRNGQMRLGSEELSNLLRLEAANSPRTFIIVDALDESPELRGTRMAILSELLQLSRVTNVFVSSRPLPSIAEHFAGHPRVEIRANDQDIRSYVSGRLGEAPSLSTFLAADPALMQEIESAIVGKVQGIFLLAELHLNSFSTYDNRRQLKKALITLPVDYTSTFDAAMKRIKQQATQVSARAMQVLCWVTNALQPLSELELQHALAVETGDKEFYTDAIVDSNHLISICCGLVAVDENSRRIRLVHYTLEEYLSVRKDELFPGSADELTAVCITYLSFDTFASGPALDDDTMRTRLEDFAFLPHAAESWGRYAAQARDSETWLHIHQFLCREGSRHSAAQAMDVPDYYYFKKNWSQNFPKNVSALWLAAHFGLCELASTLLKNGTEVDEVDGWGWTPLLVATENEQISMVNLLLNAGASIHHVENNGNTVVGIAAQTDNLDLVDLFRQKGADLKYRNNDGETLLHQAASGNCVEVAKALLSWGLNIDDRDNKGCTPLHQAAEGGSIDICQNLLERGLSASHRDKLGYPVLFKAMEKEHVEVVSLLLRYGASANDCTPLYRTSRFWKASVSNMEQENIGGPLLCMASYQGSEDIVKLLIEHGADIQAANTKGETGLYEASAFGHPSVVSTFISKGVDAGKTRTDGKAPLFAACSGGHSAVAAILIKADGSPSLGEADLIAALGSQHWQDPKADLLSLLLNAQPGIRLTEAVLMEAAASAYADTWSVLLDFDKNPVIDEKLMLQLVSRWDSAETFELFTNRGLNFPCTDEFIGQALAESHFHSKPLFPKICKLRRVTVTDDILYHTVTKLGYSTRSPIEMLISQANLISITDLAIGLLAVKFGVKNVEPLMHGGSRLAISARAVDVRRSLDDGTTDLENLKRLVGHPLASIDVDAFEAICRRHGGSIIQTLLSFPGCPALSESMFCAVAAYGTVDDLRKVSNLYTGHIDVDKLVERVCRAFGRYISEASVAKLDFILARFDDYKASEDVLMLCAQHEPIFDKVFGTNPDYVVTEELLIRLISGGYRFINQDIWHADARKMHVTFTDALLNTIFKKSRNTQLHAVVNLLLGRPDGIVVGQTAVTQLIKRRTREVEHFEKYKSKYASLTRPTFSWDEYPSSLNSWDYSSDRYLSYTDEGYKAPLPDLHDSLLNLIFCNIKADDITETIACDIATALPDEVVISMLGRVDLLPEITNKIFNAFAAHRGDGSIKHLITTRQRRHGDHSQPGLDVSSVFQRFEAPTVELIMKHFPEVVMDHKSLIYATQNKSADASDLLAQLWDRYSSPTSLAPKLLKGASQNETSFLSLAKVILSKSTSLEVSETVLKRAAGHRYALPLLHLFTSRTDNLSLFESTFCAAARLSENPTDVLQELFRMSPNQPVTVKILVAVLDNPCYTYKTEPKLLDTLRFVLGHNLVPDLMVTKPLAVAAKKSRRSEDCLEVLLRKLRRVSKDAGVYIFKKFELEPVHEVLHDLNIPVRWSPSYLRLISRNWSRNLLMMEILQKSGWKALDPVMAASAPVVFRHFDPNVIRQFILRFWQGTLSPSLVHAAVSNPASSVKLLKQLVKYDPEMRFTSRDLATAISTKRGRNFVNFILSHGCEYIITVEVSRLARQRHRERRPWPGYYRKTKNDKVRIDDDHRILDAKALLELVGEVYSGGYRAQMRCSLATIPHWRNDRRRRSSSISSEGSDSLPLDILHSKTPSPSMTKPRNGLS